VTTKITVNTKNKRAVLDITSLVENVLQGKIHQPGLCHLFLVHTTAALTTADLDPGTNYDLLDAFDAMVPKLAYRHPHNPAHVPDHIMSALIGTSLTIPIQEGKLILGTWQRVVLVEFNGPRQREIVVSLNG